MAQAPQERHLYFDFGGMRERAMRGPRRAAAFLGLTERFLEGDIPRSLTVKGNMQIRLLPDPISDEMSESLREEFHHWVLTNALRELDQVLSLMLDECWDIVEACRIVAGERPAHYQWKRIELQTNVAAKHRHVLDAAGKYDGAHIDDNDALETLSNARNCIAHNLGIVDRRRAPDGSMTVRWLALRTKIVAGDNVYFLDEVELPFELPGDEEGHVYAHVEIAERVFQLGERVSVTPTELMQIALLYQMIIDRLVGSMEERAREAGVPFPQKPPEAEADPPPA